MSETAAASRAFRAQVVGGYLGYVGYFCIAAGISLACGVEVRAPALMMRAKQRPLHTNCFLFACPDVPSFRGHEGAHCHCFAPR